MAGKVIIFVLQMRGPAANPPAPVLTILHLHSGINQLFYKNIHGSNLSTIKYVYFNSLALLKDFLHF